MQEGWNSLAKNFKWLCTCLSHVKCTMSYCLETMDETYVENTWRLETCLNCQTQTWSPQQYPCQESIYCRKVSSSAQTCLTSQTQTCQTWSCPSRISALWSYWLKTNKRVVQYNLVQIWGNSHLSSKIDDGRNQVIKMNIVNDFKSCRGMMVEY